MTIERFRIGVNTLFFIPGEVGGSETYLRRTLSAMAKNFPGVDLVLFTNLENEPTFRKDLASHPQVYYHQLHFRASNRYMRIVREQTELPVAVKKRGVHVLWSPGYTAPFFCPCPQVATIHDMQYKTHPEDLSCLARITTDILVRAAVRRSDRIITCSEFSKSEVIRFTGAEEQKIHAIHLGVDPQFAAMLEEETGKQISSLNPVADKPFILSVANTYPHKNLHKLIDAFRQIMDRIEHRLVLVGLPRLGEDRVKASLSRISDPSRVVRLSGLTQPQLIALYRGADLFVFPSLYEGFGLPVLEAMAVGTPVVTTRMGSIPEVGGRNVLYADPPKSEQIAIHILEILHWEESRRSRWLESARKRAGTFSWTETAQKTMKVLQEAGQLSFAFAHPSI